MLWPHKGKGVPNRSGVAQGVPGGLGSQISWHSAREDDEVVSLMHRPPLLPGMFLVDPRAMVWSEGNMSLKNQVTPPGIDPGTFRLVAQRLNHYATPVVDEVWNMATNMSDGILVVTIKMSYGGSNSFVCVYQTIRYHMPKGHNIDIFRHTNLKSKIKLHLPLHICIFSSKLLCKWTVKIKEKSYLGTPLGYMGGGGADTVTLLFYLETKKRWVVSFTSRPL